MHRRRFLIGSIALLGLNRVRASFPTAGTSPGAVLPADAADDREWRDRLSPEQFQIMRRHGTERARSSALDGERGQGIYHCAACDQPLFDSRAKYEHGTGWPSFWAALPDAVDERAEPSALTVRTGAHCARCDSHLGYKFDKGPRPTGWRYSINGRALRFIPRRSGAIE